MSKKSSTFAGGMRRIREIGLLMCLLWMAGAGMAWAETIRLKSGQTVEGTILFQNEEVVVIRDASGAKYQYPASEVVQEPKEDALPASSESRSPNSGEQDVNASNAGEDSQAVYTGRKVAMGISVFGGGMALPKPLTGELKSPQLGGHAGANVMVGTSNLFHRRIFLGGATGFHAYMTGGKVLSFIPVLFRAEVPLMLTKHAPQLGMGVGYGIGIQGTKGGVCADIEFGWRCNYSRKGAIFMGIFGDFQGTEMELTETISGHDYTSLGYRALCGFGAKMALFF